MFRTCYYLAILAMMFFVRLSEGFNCTKTSFTQDFTDEKLAAAQLIADDYATLTKAQIIAKLFEEFNDTLVSADYTVTTVGDTTTIDYQIIFGCNTTTTTVLPDGTQQTNVVATNVNKTKVQNSVATALTDRANQVSLKADQVKSGATDTTCNFNAGGENYFEWTIQTSSSSYSSALSAGSFKNANDFQSGLVNFFRTKLTGIYPGQIANVTFMSQKSASTGYNLTFRVYFTGKITLDTKRTEIVSKIQSTYYDVITTYFKSVSKTMNIPTSVTINAPPAVSVVSKKAVILTSGNSSQSIGTGSLLNLTKVSSTSEVKTVTSTKTGTSGSETGTKSVNTVANTSKTVSVQSSGSGSKGVSLDVNVKGGSTDSKTSVKLGSAGGSSATNVSKTVSVQSSGSGSKGVSLDVNVKGGSADSKTSINTGIVGGASVTVGGTGNNSKQISTTITKNGTSSGLLTLNVKGSNGDNTVSVKTSKDTDKSPESKSSSSSKDSTKTSTSGINKTVTLTKEGNQTAGGKLSITGKSDNGKSGPGESEEKKSSAASSGADKKAVTSTTQKNQTLDGKLSITGKTDSGKSGSSGSGDKKSNATSGTADKKTVTSTTQKNQTVDGKLTIKGKSDSGKSDSSGSGDKKANATSGSTGKKTVTTTTLKNQTLDGKLLITVKSDSGKSGSSGSGDKKSNATSGSTGKKTVTSTTQKNQTLGGKLTIKGKSDSGKSDSSGSGDKKSNATSGSTGKKTVTSTIQQNQTVGGKVSITTKQNNQTVGGKLSITVKSDSEKPGSTGSANKTSNAAPASTDKKPVTKTEQQTKQVQGSTNVNAPKSTGGSPTNNSSGAPASQPSQVPSSPSKSGPSQAVQPASKPAATKGAEPAKKPAATKESQPANKSAATKGAEPAKKPTATKGAEPAKKPAATKEAQPTSTGKDKKDNIVVNVVNTVTSALKKSKGKNGTAVPSSVKTGKQTGPTKKKPSSASVKTNKNVNVVPSTGKGNNRKSKLTIKSLTKTSGQSIGKKVIKLPRTGKSLFLGQSYGVTDRESNAVRDMTIDTIPYEYKNIDIDSSSLNGLLAYLLYGHGRSRVSSGKSESSGCAPQDTYVNYVYEYDIQNQVFNSSFQDPNSIVVQRLQSDIADWTAEEIYKRNLVSYVTDDARLTKIIDVSKQYNNRATLRFYISINVSKNLIPVIRRVLETVGDKLQTERFSTSNKKIDWGNMVLIPIKK